MNIEDFINSQLIDFALSQDDIINELNIEDYEDPTIYEE